MQITENDTEERTYLRRGVSGLRPQRAGERAPPQVRVLGLLPRPGRGTWPAGARGDTASHCGGGRLRNRQPRWLFLNFLNLVLISPPRENPTPWALLTPNT